jgi:hypothetical protein
METENELSFPFNVDKHQGITVSDGYWTLLMQSAGIKNCHLLQMHPPFGTDMFLDAFAGIKFLGIELLRELAM